MDINAITQAVSSIGFPIVCCWVMFKYLEKEQQAHKEEMNNVTKALNENTKVIESLKTLLETMRGLKNGS